ncbi:unnamed protein product [Mytilus edulis]|uniref:PiggyBac transposable element-derived protein domain-containing protein n=1 Tax=Mytilus edulis TaxID=6550 RepID=A0A8S3QKU6_MYTED|nr:unnamed protein product [Mytilus edulis]
MAAFIDDGELDDFIQEYFGESDEDSEFEGFDLNDIITDNDILSEILFEQDDKDINVGVDEQNGWSRIDTPPICAPFTGTPGLNTDIDLGEDPQPIDFFNLLFNNSMWDTIVLQTNLYANRKLQNDELKPNSRITKWRPTSIDEMKVFFSLIISMGLTRKGDLDAYWSTDEVINTPFFSKMMAKDRFMNILANLHLNDNNLANTDRLYKVRPFITMMRDTFGVYTPEESLSFDEGTCPFKGRVKFRVYNPMKPNKFGIKLYQCCEARSGYCVAFDIYDADAERSCSIYADTVGVAEDCTHTTKLVVGLLAFCGLLLKGYKVYLDNYYCSPELFNELDLLNTYACGTVRTNRKLVPKAFTEVKKLKQGQGIFRRMGNLLAIKFHDKRDVHMLSTMHEAKLIVTDRVNKDNEPVLKPNLVVDYCKFMGGVDMNDQICQYYDVLRKSVKWWKTLFFHLFNVLLVNVYVLFKKYGKPAKRRTHQMFRQSLIRALIDEAVDAPLPDNTKGRKCEPIGRLTGKHFPQYIPAKEGAKRKRPLRDCKACNFAPKDRQGNRRTQTSFYCPKCVVALCVPDCFHEYHTKKDYKRKLGVDDNSSSSSSESE